jgi:hypothetical protein
LALNYKINLASFCQNGGTGSNRRRLLSGQRLSSYVSISVTLGPSMDPPESLSFRLALARFAQPYTCSSAVLVDELDAGGFQGAANGQVVSCSHGSFAIS